MSEIVDFARAHFGRMTIPGDPPGFDFEVPANTGGDGNPDINGRLTMRDVILKRSNAGVETSNAKGANFQQLAAGADPRHAAAGQTRVDVHRRQRAREPARSGSSTPTSRRSRPTTAPGQAAELVEPPGPATGPLPVILVGDLNSDDNTVTGADTVGATTSSTGPVWSSGARTSPMKLLHQPRTPRRDGRRQHRRLRPPHRPRPDRRSRRASRCWTRPSPASTRSTDSGTPTTPESSAPLEVLP